MNMCNKNGINTCADKILLLPYMVMLVLHFQLFLIRFLIALKTWHHLCNGAKNCKLHKALLLELMALFCRSSSLYNQQNSGTFWPAGVWNIALRGQKNYLIPIFHDSVFKSNPRGSEEKEMWREVAQKLCSTGQGGKEGCEDLVSE